MVTPGKTIGVLGGGQLGRMLGQAAASLGYRFHVFEPAPDCPAGAVANKEVNAAYDDIESLQAFARGCDVITYEFENVPTAPMRAIEGAALMQPHWRVLQTCQNRSREKNWLLRNGFSHARFAEVAAGGDVASAVRSAGLPCVIKTADFGYDGKGQVKVSDESGIAEAVRLFAGRACVIEQWIDFACEISVVVARTEEGQVRSFPVAENIHTNHILDFSIVPARVGPEVLAAAEVLSQRVAEKIGLVGVMGVEMFVGKTGELLINELAPRTHNSGHYTIDACATSQFEQQVRAVCGLPLGDTLLLSPVVMVNILGEAWAKGDPNWSVILAEPSAKLHLYGKNEVRSNRKMGHFTVTANDAEAALTLARQLKSRLYRD